MTDLKRRLINADQVVIDLGARLLAANQELARLRHELVASRDTHDTVLRMLLAVVREYSPRGLMAVVRGRRALTVSGRSLKADQAGWHLITNPLEADDVVELRAEYAEPETEKAGEPPEKGDSP